MKFYLAARYSRHPEMQGVRDVLHAMGHTVTSRWIDQHGGNELESRTHEQLNTDPNACTIFARHDVEDIDAADAIIFFSSAGDPGKGGRFVEWGYALAKGKRMILVGSRENVFHTLPQTEHYESWSRLVMVLT
jgi:Nucleoside 2-deoxyribosyltransferase